MFTCADKVSKHVTTVQRQSAQPFFARKHADTFFSGSEKASTPASFIQPKLSVSSPEDAQEKEADQMASKVMTMPESAPVATSASQPKEELNRKEEEQDVQRMEASGIQLKEETEEVQREGEEKEIQRKEDDETSVQRIEEKQEEKIQTKAFAGSDSSSFNHIIQAKCSACEEKKVDRKVASVPLSYTVQRSSRGPPGDSEHNSSFEQNLQNTRGTGNALPGETRSFMESRFSADFSGVRIHTSETAVQMNKEVHAQAFTYGNDIYFNSGKYSPDSTEGKTLLAHELTHTIQQGASSHVSNPQSGGTSAVAPKLISRKRSIQRSAGNLSAAVNFAKGEQGKVIANKEGADGLRFGWQQLMEYFKTTLGAEKIIPDGVAGDSTTVPEGNIKKKNIAKGVNVITPDGQLAKGDRDAMPSWCGIFAFWALNKAGLPMKKWLLGNMTIPPDAMMPPGQMPAPGFIAYRNLRSHYGLVSGTAGSKVISVNGNTAGSDNLGGEVQEQTHDISEWTAFIDPMKLIDGTVRNPQSGVEGKPKSFRELQKEMFRVSRKENEHSEHEEKENDWRENESKDSEGKEVQAKKENSVIQPVAENTSSVKDSGDKEELQRKEEAKEEDKTIQRKEFVHTAGEASATDKKEELQRKEDDSEEKEVQRSTDGSSPEKEILRKEGSKEEDRPAQNSGMIQAAADSSPPQKEEEIQRKEEIREKASVQRKQMVHAPGDSSPPAHQEKEEQTSIQRKSEPKVQRLFGWVSDAIEWVGDKLEEGKKWVLEKVTKLIIKVPGYKALRVILGSDPITGEKVGQTGYDFIDAAIDIMPFGDLIKQKLEELGILDQAAKFAEKLFGRVHTLVNGIYDTFANFIDSLSLSDLKDISGVFRRLENAFTSFFDHIKNFAKGVANDFVEFIKKALLIPLGNYIKTKTRFWDLLCLIIGKDPLTDEVKSPTGANILNAICNLSEWGIEQKKKMQETGTFNKVAAWIDKGIAVFGKAYDLLKAAFKGLWNYVSIESLMHPVDTFLKIFDSFYQPVALVGKFFIEAGIAILKIVKDVLFKWISDKAKETTGYYLVTVLISKDPFTGEKVPRTTENLIKGFMMLSEGGEEQFNKMKESGAIDSATAKIDAAVATLGFTWAYVKGLFTSLWESFSWKDLLLPILAFAKIIATFKNPIMRLIRFVISIIVALFEVILRMMGFPVDLVFKLIDNVRKAWTAIKANPTGFLLNLLRAVKQGFMQFFDNILKHLWEGLKAWLKQELEDGGIPMPTDFSAIGIIKWLLVILDITMEKIWIKLEKRIGKEKAIKIRNLIAKAEAIYDKANEAMEFIDDVRKRGMEAIVDKIKEKLNNIWDMVLGAIQSFIMDQIIKKVTAKLLSMLDPTGIMAVINSAIALYKAIQSFFKYLAKILAIVNSFVEGIVEICAGNISSAANFLEGSLGRGVPVVIGFLANQVGLDLSGKIRDVLATVREKVDQGLDFLIDKLVGLVEKLVAKVKQAKDAVLGWLGLKKSLKTKDNVSHSIYFEGTGNNAVLTIATTPMAVKKFLTVEVKDKHGLKDSDIQQALKTAEDIEKLEKQPATDEAKKITDMNTLLTKLAEEIANLPLTSAGINSEILNGPLYQEHGSSAIVAFRQAPFPNGSIPMSTSTTNLSNMNIRKNGGSPYYIKGHLLNDNLGGPGTTWQNLAPINSKANSDHKTNFENPIKMVVNGKLSGSSATPLGFMKGFSVTANYGRTEPSSLTQLKDDSASDYPPGFDETKWDVNEVIKMLVAEKHAPVNLVCKATTKKDANSPEESLSYTVNNEIDYGNLKEYQLGLAPPVEVKLSDLIMKNPTATTDKEMAQTFASINGIGPARARSIYEAFKKKGKVTNGKTDMGIGLVALTKQNKGKVIRSGDFSGPWV